MKEPVTRPVDNPDSEPEEVAEHEPKFFPGQSDIQCVDCRCTLGFAEVAGFKIAACNQCRGMLIQRELFLPIVDRCRRAWQNREEQVTPLDPAETVQVTNCPVCREVMDTYPYSGPSCVVIDACNQCDVIWLNANELSRIVEAPGNRG